MSAAEASAPESPAGGDWWLDTSGGQAALRQYDSQLALWTAATSTYVKLAAPNLGKGFSLYDGVTLSGCTGALAGLNGSHVLQAVGDHFAVIPGLLGAPEASCEGAVTLERRAPDMDFVTECDNRLWGCKYGLVDGKAVNEIYASKLGDFKNWRCYQGLSTDSYAAGRGADGPFTAAATHLGHPLFFREESATPIMVRMKAENGIARRRCFSRREYMTFESPLCSWVSISSFRSFCGSVSRVFLFL